MSSKQIIQIPSEAILREQLARAISEVRKLQLLIEVARKLDEIHDGESQSGVNGHAIDQKLCVAQEPSVIRYGGRWEPQEDDLLHQCVSNSLNPHKGCIAFSRHPANKKRRTMQSAEQRYYSLKKEGKW